MRNFYCFWALFSLTLLFGSSALGARLISLDTKDGLALEFDRMGAVQGMRVGKEAIKLIRAGGFSIVDAQTQRSERAAGAIAVEKRKLHHQADLRALGLKFFASYAAYDKFIEVKVSLEDFTGTDRALIVSFQLPFEAVGWIWWDDIYRNRKVEVGKRFENTYPVEAGDGTMSVYPFSALDSKSAGISLGVPLGQGPRVFKIAYDGTEKSLLINFYLGISKETKKFPQQADFDFIFYRHDPKWGFRAAAERFYRFFPKEFRKRVSYEGYLNYANLERLGDKGELILSGFAGGPRSVEDAVDFGEGFRFLWHMHGSYDAIACPTGTEKPSDESLWRHLEEKALEEEKTDKRRYYCPFRELIKKVALTEDGSLRYYLYPKTQYPQGLLEFQNLCEDPEVSGWLAETLKSIGKDWQQDKDFKPYQACVTVDGIGGYSGTGGKLDFRREHFATADFPLTFGAKNKRLAIANPMFDFNSTVLRPISEEAKFVVLPNACLYGYLFDLPFSDIGMIEGEWGFPKGEPPTGECYFRTMSYQKLYRFWRVLDPNNLGRYDEGTEASVLDHFKRGLFMAIFPSVWAVEVVTGRLDDYRYLYRKYVPLIETVSAAGWEPVTYASVKDSEVGIERFGSFVKGNLCFTVRNFSAKDKKEVAIVVEAKPLGVRKELDKNLCLFELVYHREIPFGWKNGNLIFRLSLEPRDTLLLRLGVEPQQIIFSGSQVQRELERTSRFFGKYFSPEIEVGWRKIQGKVAVAFSPKALSKPLVNLKELAYLQSQLRELEGKIPAPSKSSLAKCFFKIRSHLTEALISLLDIKAKIVAPESVVPGDKVEIRLLMENQGRYRLANLRFSSRDAYGELKDALVCRQGLSEMAPRTGCEIVLELTIPKDFKHKLVPMLLVAEGEVNGTGLKLDFPMDIRISLKPFEVSLEPDTLGIIEEFQPMTAIVKSKFRWQQELKIEFIPPRDWEVKPLSRPFRIAPLGEVRLPLLVRLPENASRGEKNLKVVLWLPTGESIEAEAVVSIVQGVLCTRTEATPKIDGKLDELCWQGAGRVGNLRLLGEDKLATEPTEVLLLYDAKRIYIGFVCSESQIDKLKATLSQRDSGVWQDDDVVLVLCPRADLFYKIEVNPKGAIYDWKNGDAGWNGKWAVKTSIENDRWLVEMTISFADLDVMPPKPGSTWRINFCRQEKPKGEVSIFDGTSINDPASAGMAIFGKSGR